ncbi:MAG: zinc carboxypeptidase [Balneolaceae bacterium]|nr:MAG: zinc carboxypeptidase [Balneolaceae bacterium]
MNPTIRFSLFFLSLSLFSLLFRVTGSHAQLQSPDDFLGYELGERWTQQHDVLAYVKHVAQESDYVTLHTYGYTYQHRELVYLIVTSPENHANIEEIRLNNLRLTGLEPGEPTDRNTAVVWLSYNIHGNETAGTEAALRTLHELVRPDHAEPKTWLQNTVVIIDPVLNPDGRERYITGFQQLTGVEVNPSPDAREHYEAWPGGRSNHYLFDLNRDWAWQVQQESQMRYGIYRQWFPHVHADYHEMGYRAPYFFAPAADPFHLAVTDWQREFQNIIGRNHIRYFDAENWLYFTRQRFDLFYPSFGDTWPTFHGAIGMTYEMPGGGFSGLAIDRPEGDTLTLAHKILQHHITGMSTVEAASLNSDRLVNGFRDFFRNSAENPAGAWKTFVVKGDNDPDKIYQLLTTLDTKQIRYGLAGSSRNSTGFNYATGETGRVAIAPEDILVSAYQPQGNLVRVFFEPNPELTDSLTYDITAWEAHYRFGLEGYALQSRMDPAGSVSAADFRQAELTGSETPYAWLLPWASMDDARFLAQITRAGVVSRFASEPFRIEGRSFERGTLMIPREYNQHLDERFDEIVLQAARDHSRSLHGAVTGFSVNPMDLGSTDFRHLETPEIAVLIGEGTASLNAGEIWHFFDHQLGYPATMIHTTSLMRVDLSRYNVLVLPSGNYSGVLTDAAVEKVSAWTRDGGTLILFGQANRLLGGRDGFQLQRKLPEAREPGVEERLQSYGDRNRRAVSSRTSGSIFRVHVDSTHPLGYGYGDLYHSLKTDATAYSYLDSGWNVGSVQPDAHLSGFAGAEALRNLEHTLAFGVQPHGSGQVVYFIDNPLFRGFWENGKLLMANATFFVGR